MLEDYCLEVEVRRLRTGIEGFDKLIEGGIPEGFFIAVTGEPGCGKTIFAIHFIHQGVLDNDKSIYVTTEESRESIIKQASQFNIDFEKSIEEGKLIIIDALMGREDRWSLQSLDLEALVGKIIEAKKELGYGRARVAVDSISAFWLDKPAMARRYSYYLKKVLTKWDFTTLAISQYAITTSLSHDQPILVRINGESQNTPIGVLVNQLIHDSHIKNIEVACLDWRDFKIKWAQPYAVIKHVYTGPLYRVRLEDGREVSVTRDHSLFVVRDGRIKCIPTSEIIIGEYILAPVKQIEDNSIVGDKIGYRQYTKTCRDVVIHPKFMKDRIRGRRSIGDVKVLRIEDIETENVEDADVYDVSILNLENFIAGIGGVICHNSEAFGFGIEHIADGIIRFRRSIKAGELRRYVLIEKMRQTNHSRYLHEIDIVSGKGLVIVGPVERRREDFSLPREVSRKIIESRKKTEEEIP
jgi:KaiC domain protein